MIRDKYFQIYIISDKILVLDTYFLEGFFIYMIVNLNKHLFGPSSQIKKQYLTI